MQTTSQPLKIILALVLTLGTWGCNPNPYLPRQNFEASTLENNSQQIVGGTPEKNSDPSRYLVMIHGATESDKSYICTGTLIGFNVVLTAAHCIGKLQTMTIYFGLSPLNTPDAEALAIKTIKHPNYNQKALIPNDIALIKFSPRKPKNYQIATLPWRHPLIKEQFDSDPKFQFRAMGYGITTGKAAKDKNDTRGAGVLRSTPLTISTFSTSGDLFSVDQSNDKGVCLGDSGGPALVEIVRDKTKLITVLGIASQVVTDARGNTSDGDDCNYEGQYTNLWHYEDWLETTLKSF